MVQPPPYHSHTLPALLALLMVAAGITPTADAADSCLVERGQILIANTATAAISGRLVTSLQRGGWDTRPAIRLARIAPSGLVEAGRWEATWSVGDVHVAADTVIVAADFGLVSLDVSDPLHPVVVDRAALFDSDRLAVDGGIAYVASDGSLGDGWFDVVDVSDPSDLQPRGSIHWPSPDPYSGKTGIDARHGVVVVSCAAGVVVLDAGDPWQPTVRGVRQRDGAHDVAMVSGLAAVAVASPVDPADVGVEILDLSNPSQPNPVGFWPAPSAVLTVAGFGGDVVAGTESHGLYLIDITDPAHPIEIDHWQGSGAPVDRIATAWPSVAVAGAESGTIVLGLDPTCQPPRRPSGRVDY